MHFFLNLDTPEVPSRAAPRQYISVKIDCTECRHVKFLDYLDVRELLCRAGPFLRAH